MPWRTVTSARLQALAAALQPDADPALVDLDQGHPTAVSRDHRVDLASRTSRTRSARRSPRPAGGGSAGADELDAGDLGDGGAE